MGNCLKTQLKSNVSNNKLPYLGEFRFKVVSSSEWNNSKFISFVVKQGDYTIIVIGNGYIGLSSSDITHESLKVLNTSNINLYFSNGDYEIIFVQRYGLYGFYLPADENGNYAHINLEQFSQTPVNSIKIDYNKQPNTSLNKLPYLPSLRTFLCRSCEINGNTEGIAAKIPSIVEFRMTICYVDINLNDFGILSNLNTLQLSTRSSLSGDYEEFVSQQVTAGRNSGTIFLGNVPVNLAFNGTLAQSGKSYNIYWDSISKIIIYDGSSYQSSINDSTYIYAKGATAEEIAAWEQAGKTVTVIS